MKAKNGIYTIFRLILALSVAGAMLQSSSRPALAATQFDIHGPAGSVSFGASVTVLPNGNFVVTDPDYDGGIGVSAGAVYLYDGASGAMISMLTGSAAGNQVGIGGVTVLNNGNYVVLSPLWDNGGISDTGAVTWGSNTSGVSGAVSAANSLIGSTADDRLGSSGVTALSNGNYVVSSIFWDHGSATNAGAVTWGNGGGGTSGTVSASNSLVGSHVNDQVGYQGIIELSNGNYVVSSRILG